jgi:hypothetical protein
MKTSSLPVGVTGLHRLEAAIQSIITRLYAGFSFSDKTINRHHIKKSERNTEITARFAVGESLSDIGREFGLTPQRVYQIVHGKRK